LRFQSVDNVARTASRLLHQIRSYPLQLAEILPAVRIYLDVVLSNRMKFRGRAVLHPHRTSPTPHKFMRGEFLCRTTHLQSKSTGQHTPFTNFLTVKIRSMTSSRSGWRVISTRLRSIYAKAAGNNSSNLLPPFTG